jgi:hypothetical protein
LANERTLTVQGVDVPASSINDKLFFALTRRQVRAAKPLTNFAGLGSTDEFQLVHDGIVAGLEIRVTGNVVGVGTAAVSTRRWPYDLLRAVRFAANGQTNLINCSGLKLRALQMMRPDCNDRGVDPLGGVSGTQTKVGITGAQPGFSVQSAAQLGSQGTLANAGDIWGLGSGATGIAAGTYPFDFKVFAPVAFDQKTLQGAIFAQTEGTNLTLALDWEVQANLLSTLFGTSTTWTIQFSVHEYYFDIPVVSGKRILPSGILNFHQVLQSRATTSIAVGDNEFILPGIAKGRQLMALFWQIWNGSPSVPLPMNSTNYGPQSWVYGGNQNPERYLSGQDLQLANERLFNSNVGIQWGFGAFDFANEWAFRDLVDLGSTNDLRLVSNIASGVTLTSPAWEVVQEVLIGAAGNM